VRDFEAAFLSAYRILFSCNIFIFKQSDRILYSRCLL